LGFGLEKVGLRASSRLPPSIQSLRIKSKRAAGPIETNLDETAELVGTQLELVGTS